VKNREEKNLLTSKLTNSISHAGFLGLTFEGKVEEGRGYREGESRGLLLRDRDRKGSKRGNEGGEWEGRILPHQ